MPEIDILIAAGMDPNIAFDTVYCFLHHRNADGLERYVRKLERSGRIEE